MAAVQFGPNSTALWVISPPDLQRLKDDLAKNVTLKVRYKYSISRTTYSEKMSGTVEGERSFDILEDSPARQGLITMLNQGNVTEPIELPFLFPKFLKVKNLGDLKPVPQLYSNYSTGELDTSYRNLTLKLHGDGSADKWWEVLEDCSDDFYSKVLGQLPYANCISNTVLYTFSDKLFPPTLSWLTAGGLVYMPPGIQAFTATFELIIWTFSGLLVSTLHSCFWRRAFSVACFRAAAAISCTLNYHSSIAYYNCALTSIWCVNHWNSHWKKIYLRS